MPSCLPTHIRGREPPHSLGAPSGSRTSLAGLMSPAPIFLGFSLDRRRVRIFALDPVWRAAGTVTRVLALRHDAFKAELAGMLEDSGAVLSEMLIETQPGRGSRKQAHQ